MSDLSRKSFIQALVSTTALPIVADGLPFESDKTNDVPTKRINATYAASLMEKYGLTPIKEKPGTFDFYIGKMQCRYGFISKINLWGIEFATKENLRAIVSISETATILQAIRIKGKWQYTPFSTIPRDFPIYDFAAAVDAREAES